MVEKMWGLRSPTPRGRTESCTLHILADVLTGAHGKGLHVGWLRHSSGFRGLSEHCAAGLPGIFNASTLSLVPSRSLAQWKTLLRKFFPKHANGTLPRHLD